MGEQNQNFMKNNTVHKKKKYSEKLHFLKTYQENLSIKNENKISKNISILK